MLLCTANMLSSAFFLEYDPVPAFSVFLSLILVLLLVIWFMKYEHVILQNPNDCLMPMHKRYAIWRKIILQYCDRTR